MIILVLPDSKHEFFSKICPQQASDWRRLPRLRVVRQPGEGLYISTASVGSQWALPDVNICRIECHPYAPCIEYIPTKS